MNRKHVFLLNPAAGQGQAIGMREQIENISQRLSLDTEIYETKEELDAQVFTSQLIKNNDVDTKIRLYACGGDGTANEILNAIIGHDNMELAVMPMGTGNDFVRNFGDVELFRNLEYQMTADTVKTDVIRYTWKRQGFSCSRYCINMFNIGFDCNVVEMAGKLKKKPLISGSMAYLAGVAAMLVKMKGADLKVEFEDGKVFDGKMLLIAIANGCFCGGGVKGVPKALTDDGFMDISLVRKCSRRRFIQLFPKYAKGEHLNVKGADKLIIYRKAKTLKITANGEPFTFSTDGELTKAKEIEFEIVPGAVDFVVPQQIESNK